MVWYSHLFQNFPQFIVGSVQFSSVTQSCPTLCDPMNCSTPGLPVHHQLPELTQTHVHQVGDAIQPSHPVVPFSFLPPIHPSIRVFSNESALRMRWPKYWSFSFSIRLSKEHLDSILKNRDITLPTKVHLVKAMVFPVVIYGCETWTIKKAEHRRTDVFELWCWRSLLRVPWTARRSNQSILKEISPGCLFEGLMLKLNSNTLATSC